MPPVSSYHTDFSRYTEAYGVGRLRGTVSRYIARFHKRSARVYTPSEPAREDLRCDGRRPGGGVGPRRGRAEFTPTKWSGALREQLGADDKFVFLHVGRLAAEKNVELVLDAIACSGTPIRH